MCEDYSQWKTNSLFTIIHCVCARGEACDTVMMCMCVCVCVWLHCAGWDEL